MNVIGDMIKARFEPWTNEKRMFFGIYWGLLAIVLFNMNVSILLKEVVAVLLILSMIRTAWDGKLTREKHKSWATAQKFYMSFYLSMLETGFFCWFVCFEGVTLFSGMVVLAALVVTQYEMQIMKTMKFLVAEEETMKGRNLDAWKNYRR